MASGPRRPAAEHPGCGTGQLGRESVLQRVAWEFDPIGGEYYLHLFSRQQPDLNRGISDVRAAIHEMMRCRLGRGVDGFRMDVITMISRDVALPDSAVMYGAFGDGARISNAGRASPEFLWEMYREVLAGRPEDVLTVGEMPGVRVDQALAFTGPDRRELDMVFQFKYVALDHGPVGKWDLRPLRLAERGWNSPYWDFASVLAALRSRSRDNARTRCTGTVRRPPDSPRGSCGSRSIRTTWTSTRRRRSATRPRSSLISRPDDPVTYAFSRRLGRTELLVVANVGSDSRRTPVPAESQWVAAPLLPGNRPDRDGGGDALLLRPWEARVYRRVR